MRILCNMPLECFDDRRNLRGVELCTFGPKDRMMVEGVHYPLDVDFDPSRGSIEELFARLPDGFVPDLVLIWWPDQEPLPANLHRCPVPVVGIVSDYNLMLPSNARLQSQFDVLLCDRNGVELFEKLGYPDVRYFCQYTFKRPFHERRLDAERPTDVAFAGNLNPAVQRERAPWIARLCNLESRGVRLEVRQGVNGAAYGDMLGRSRIGFNRSIRGEMNLRAFEVPAAGALLLMERENREVREFFVPDEECVLYGEDDFEQVVLSLLRDEPRRQRIAAAGHRRVQDHSLGNRMPALLEVLATKGRGRAPCSELEVMLGRAEAMLTTWAAPEAAVAAAMAVVRSAPSDARALNVLALATIRWRGPRAAVDAVALLQRACAADSRLVAPAWNLAQQLQRSDRPDLYIAAVDEALQRAHTANDIDALLGPLLPIGFARAAVDWSHALQRAVRSGRAADAALALRPEALPLLVPSPT